jgi:hypothetical protein
MAAAQLGMELHPVYDKYDFPVTDPEKREGFAGFLTPDQQSKVKELREQLEAAGCTKRLDTLTLLRFLRARKWDVAQSKEMFLNTEKWRKETNLDEIVDTWSEGYKKEKEALFKYYPQYYHKTDKDGRPIYIEKMGGINLTEMYKITTAERMLTNLAVEYEKLADDRLPAASRKAGHLLETCCTIMDLKGVGITKVSQVYAYVKEASAMSQNHYPERLGKMYLINAPWGFSGVWNAVKGWLDPVTVKKIHILGSGFVSDLGQQVDIANLPKDVLPSSEQKNGCVCPGATDNLENCHFSDAGPWNEAEWKNKEKPAAPAAAPAAEASDAPAAAPAPAAA